VPDTNDNLTQALATVGVGPAAKELYVDLLRPTAVETGKNLLVIARLISVAMAPFAGMVWGMERVRDWIAAAMLKRLARTAPDQIQSPPPYIAGQILLQLPFCAEQEELREMYANLLAAAMTKKLAVQVHPAFIQIIQQLTPDEALIVRQIADGGPMFSLQERFDDSQNLEKDTISLSDQFRVLCESAVVSQPAMSDAYLDNLLRLKVLSETQWSEGRLHTPHAFERAEQRVENTSGRLVELSAFGNRFILTCVLPSTGREELSRRS
jgi:hypothetical protein